MIAMLGTTEVLLLTVVLFAPLALAAVAFWVWMLVDAIRSQALTAGERTAWVIAICLLHVLGALVYFLFGRRGPSRSAGQLQAS
jgi:hypothetical protein